LQVIDIQEVLARLALKQIELDRAYDTIRELQAQLARLQSPVDEPDHDHEGEEATPDAPAP